MRLLLYILVVPQWLDIFIDSLHEIRLLNNGQCSVYSL